MTFGGSAAGTAGVTGRSAGGEFSTDFVGAGSSGLLGSTLVFPSSITEGLASGSTTAGATGAAGATEASGCGLGTTTAGAGGAAVSTRLSHAVEDIAGTHCIAGAQEATGTQAASVGISHVGTLGHSGTTISQQLLLLAGQSRFSKRSMNFPARAGENVVRVQRVATNASLTQ